MSQLSVMKELTSNGQVASAPSKSCQLDPGRRKVEGSRVTIATSC